MSESRLPLLRRFPGLAALPRVRLANLPTPVYAADSLATGLWIKRDDLAGEPFGGNKLRALEFLLGAVREGDRIVTVGSMGSTHALATAIYARGLGARVSVFRWPQEMNADADRVAKRIATAADRSPRSRSLPGAYLRAIVERLRGARWIPAGGSTPVGVLGHVNAALELAEQIAHRELPAPRRIIVPLGSGGTAAGLALGSSIAGLDTEIIAVRVAPRVIANRQRVMRLTRKTAKLIQQHAGVPVAEPPGGMLRVIHDFYGGAYGRPSAAGTSAAQRARAASIIVDATYTAKSLAAAFRVVAAEGPTLFWLSFDGRG